MKIGIDLGGSHIGVGIINNGKIEYKVEKDLKQEEKGKDSILELITKLVDGIIRESRIKKEKIEVIGIAFPGIVSEGIIEKSKNLQIEYIELKKEMENKYPGIKIAVKNDAKSAALAEKKYGVLKEYKDAIMLTIGTGIGGAVFYNNELLKSKNSEGYELGHIIIQKDGKQCSCGSRGCFEAYASISNLKKEIINTINTSKELTGVEIVEILKQKQGNTEKVLEEYINNLAIGIANLINIFEPQGIALGGSIVFYKELILEKLIDKLQKEPYVFNKNAMPEILMAELNNDAGMIGSTIS